MFSIMKLNKFCNVENWNHHSVVSLKKKTLILFLLSGMLKDVEDELQRKVKVFVPGQFYLNTFWNENEILL